MKDSLLSLAQATSGYAGFLLPVRISALVYQQKIKAKENDVFNIWTKRFRLVLIVTMLALAAATLPFIFLDYGESHITTYSDYSEKKSIEADALIITSFEVAHATCFIGEPCREIAFAIVRGFFPGPHLPPTLAVIGGLIMPYLLLVIVAFLLGGRLVGWVRVAAASLSFAAGFSIFMPAVAQACNAVSNFGVNFVSVLGYFPTFLLWTIVGLTLLIFAAWLFVRVYRGSKRRTIVDHPP